MIIYKFVIKRYFKNKSDVVFLFLLPLVLPFLPVTEWLNFPAGFQFYGVLQLYMGARLSSVLMRDRSNNILLRIEASPVTTFQYLLQNLLAYSSLMIAVNLIVVLLGGILHNFSIIIMLQLFLLYFVFSLTSIGLAITWYTLFRDEETAFSILIGFYMFIAMISGVAWPIEIMPEFVEVIAKVLPTYWYAEAFRTIAFSLGFSRLLLPLIILSLYGILFIMIGSKRRMT